MSRCLHFSSRIDANDHFNAMVMSLWYEHIWANAYSYALWLKWVEQIAMIYDSTFEGREGQVWLHILSSEVIEMSICCICGFQYRGLEKKVEGLSSLVDFNIVAFFHVTWMWMKLWSLLSFGIPLLICLGSLQMASCLNILSEWVALHSALFWGHCANLKPHSWGAFVAFSPKINVWHGHHQRYGAEKEDK